VINKNYKIQTVSFYTLGCKLNQAETNSLRTRFVEKGYKVVQFKTPADLTIINTCTVTNSADSKSRQIIRNAIKSSPSGRIIVVGCYSQVNPKELRNIEGVDMILGTHEKYKIFDFLNELDEGKLNEPLIYVGDSDEIESYDETPFISSTGRTRAFLKVQEGCDYFCSYCIIPFARGRARSRKLNDCVNESKKFVDQGYKEVILTGINIGTWNENSLRISDLLDKLSQINGLSRIRVSSIEPNTVTTDLLHLVNERKNIYNHLHIPLQSGSNTVLERMGRKYRIDEYIQLCDRIQNIVPNIGLGTDIITGFPGESDKEFQETMDFISKFPFSYLHIFRYSERNGTVASKMPFKIDQELKKKRSKILHEIGKKKKTSYADKFQNSTQEVLFEMSKNGFSTGMTSNYIRIGVSSSRNFTNTIQSVKLIENSESFIKGEIISK